MNPRDLEQVSVFRRYLLDRAYGPLPPDERSDSALGRMDRCGAQARRTSKRGTPLRRRVSAA